MYPLVAPREPTVRPSLLLHRPQPHGPRCLKREHPLSLHRFNGGETPSRGLNYGGLEERCELWFGY